MRVGRPRTPLAQSIDAGIVDFAASPFATRAQLSKWSMMMMRVRLGRCLRVDEFDDFSISRDARRRRALIAMGFER